MAITIIIKGKHKPTRRKGSRPNSMLGPHSPEADRQYRGVSQENKGEYQTEKRVQELTKGGFNEAAISGMMKIPESSVKTLRKKTGQNIHLDGKI